MAGVFSPQFQGDVAYERPIEQPSALGALAGLGEFFVGQYGDKLAQDAKAAGSRSSKIDPNLAVFQQGLERVQAIRDQQGETAGLIAERRLAQNFAMAGIDFGTEYQNVYKTTTGREWAGYGRDVESLMREEALKDPQVQASFIASYAMLPQDASDEARLEYALGQKATLQASADIIARSKAEGGIRWNTQTEAAYGQAIDTFLNTNMGALVATNQGGGRVGPQSLANMQASWSQLKVNISRPSGVSDDQWKATQEKITNIDNMISSLQKAASSDVLFEEITTALASNLIKQGDGDTTSIVAAMTAIKDPSVLSNLGGLNVETFLMDVGKSINLNITQPQLFSHLLQQPGASAENGVVTVETLPPSIASRVEGLSPQQYYDGLKASGKLTGLTDQNALQRPEGRQQFVENAAGIGAVLMSMDNDQFLSPSFLKELVGNPQFLRNVKALEGVDAEGATVAKSYIVSGLNTERVRQERNLASLEGLANSATWNGQTYVVNRQALEGRASGMRIQEFEKSLTRYYGGDLVAAARDGFKRMYDVTDVLQVGGFFNLEQAMLRRDALGTITNTVNTLNPPTEVAGTVDLTMETLSGRAPMDLITTAQSALGLNENGQRDLVAQYLAEGGVNIDPSKTAWCAAFVNATLAKNGLDGTGALNARSFLNWGEEVTTPQIGDIVVLSRGQDPNLGHVGFFKGFDANGNILILGGNQGDAVSVQSYSADRLLGYRRVPGSTGVGTEAGLARNIYRIAQDPTILPAAMPTVEAPAPAPEPVAVEATPVETTAFAQTTTGSARAAGEAGRGGQAGGETNALDAMAADRASGAAGVGPTIPADVAALIQALGQRTLTDEEKKKIQDFVGAQ